MAGELAVRSEHWGEVWVATRFLQKCPLSGETTIERVAGFTSMPSLLPSESFQVKIAAP